MLLYVSSGSRDFSRHPVAPYRRDCWEFYAVLLGRVAPVFAGVARPFLSGDTFWLFAPDNVHGWCGERTGRAQIAVFHFERVAPALAARVPKGGYLRAPLGSAPARAIARLARELQPLAWQDGEVAGLRAERAMLDLGVIMLESLLAHTPWTALSAERRVELAERWFAGHLELRPTLSAVACRLGVSPAQMRRLFVAERGLAPKAVFERIRLSNAETLLANSDLKLEAVAAASGYSSASVLVQAFRRARGVTPDAWRRGHGRP